MKSQKLVAILTIANLLVTCLAAFFGIFSLYVSPISYNFWIYTSPVIATLFPLAGLIIALFLFSRNREATAIRVSIISLFIGALFCLIYPLMVKPLIAVF